MSLIIFDLEWNMGYPKADQSHFDEIIEIGAVKLEGDTITGQYKEYVRPSVHKTIHHHIRKMLPFTKKDLRDARPFRTVIQEFKAWCGPNAQLVSWGNSDISVLQKNLEQYHLAPDWVGEVYDLQAAYAYLLGEFTRQYSLKDTVEQFELSAPEEFHDAANDAYYTALIALELKKRYPRLPTMEEVTVKREQLRAERAEELLAKSMDMEVSSLAEATPLEERTCGAYPSLEEWMRSAEANVWHCPNCARRIRSTGWTPYGEGYITRGRCPEHGWFYLFARIEQDGKGNWHGTHSTYPPTSKIKGAYFRYGHGKKEKK